MNMENLWFLIVTVAVISLCGLKAGAQIAALHLQNEEIREGDAAATLSCAITDPPDNYEVIFIRQLPSGANDILYINSRVPYDMKPKYAVSQTSQHTYRLTIWNITRLDAGRYVCRLGVPNVPDTGSISFISSGSSLIDVFYLPDLSTSPYCSMLHKTLDYIPDIGEAITLQCISRAGNPIVNMKWYQNDRWDISNSRTSKPSTSLGTVVSELQVTILPEHRTSVFRCEITSTGYPSFSHSCSIGPFLKPASASPIVTTKSSIGNSDSITTKCVKSQNSVGKQNDDIMSTLKMPISAGAAGIVCILILVIVIGVFVVRRRRNDSKNIDDEEGGGQLTIKKIKQDTDIKSDKSPSIKHIAAPNNGAMYAIVQKGKTDKDDEKEKNLPDVLSRSKTLPTVSIAPNHNKSYPPPPSYPTKQQQQELNKIIDKNSGANFSRNCYQHASIATSSPSRYRRQTEPDINTHEYATLEEFSPQEPSMPTRNSTGLYNTVNLY